MEVWRESLIRGKKLGRYKTRYHIKQANSFSTVNKFSQTWFYQGDVGRFWKYDKWSKLW